MWWFGWAGTSAIERYARYTAPVARSGCSLGGTGDARPRGGGIHATATHCPAVVAGKPGPGPDQPLRVRLPGRRSVSLSILPAVWRERAGILRSLRFSDGGGARAADRGPGPAWRAVLFGLCRAHDSAEPAGPGAIFPGCAKPPRNAGSIMLAGAPSGR